MIVENPCTQPHYLTMYFPLRPKLVDKDRTKNGDHFRKPTQYWFVNCEPCQNITMEPLEFVQPKTVSTREKGQQTKRSLIHKQYARRFILNHVLDAKGGVWS